MPRTGRFVTARHTVAIEEAGRRQGKPGVGRQEPQHLALAGTARAQGSSGPAIGTASSRFCLQRRRLGQVASIRRLGHAWVGGAAETRTRTGCKLRRVHCPPNFFNSIISSFFKTRHFSFKRENSAVVQLESASGVLVRRTAHCAVWTLESECSKLYYIL